MNRVKQLVQPISTLATRRMNIQYVSDIHLEFHDKKNTGQIQPDMFVRPGAAPYLALCGDIGIPELPAYRTFLEWCSGHWRKVFLIAGNHEYYNYRLKEPRSMEQKKQTLHELVEHLPNVFFLDCGVHQLADEGIDVLGCTFWSHVPQESRLQAVTYMNDYRQIKEMTVEKFNALHAKERSWLLSEIERCEKEGKRALVLTHYLPSFQLVAEKYAGHPLNCCFASQSDHLIQWPVCGWLCGHSHTGAQKDIHGVACALNPHGYPAESVETRSREAILTIWPLGPETTAVASTKALV